MKKICTISVFIFAFLFSPFLSRAQTYYVDYDSLSSGMTSPGAYVLALYNSDTTQNLSDTLYAGGHFTVAGGDTCYNIAEWIEVTANYYGFEDGEWYPLGTGVNNNVCAITSWNGYLYAGGKFDTAGGIAASHIAKWNIAGKTWDSLKGQLNGNVYALCVYHNALYVGGDFTIAGGDTVYRIAVWEDSVWAPAGAGFDTGAVYALTVSNDTLYAGGSFIKSGSKTVNHIAKWNGTSWNSLGSGTNNTVYALTDWNYGLYVGGAFTQSGGIPTSYVSTYDDYVSYQWSALFGGGTNDTVRALCPGSLLPVSKDHTYRNSQYASYLLIGGVFDSAWGGKYPYLTWYYLNNSPSLLSGPVYAISTVLPNYIEYVGGQFASAYNVDLGKTTILNNVASLDVEEGTGISNLSNKYDITAYPNPSTGTFNIIVNSKLSIVNGMHVAVYNILGEQIYGTSLSINNSPFSINLGGPPNGVYLYRITDENGDLIGEGKLIIEK